MRHIIEKPTARSSVRSESKIYIFILYVNQWYTRTIKHVCHYWPYTLELNAKETNDFKFKSVRKTVAKIIVELILVMLPISSNSRI